jgi:hypothetical protein
MAGGFSPVQGANANVVHVKKQKKQGMLHCDTASPPLQRNALLPDDENARSWHGEWKVQSAKPAIMPPCAIRVQRAIRINALDVPTGAPHYRA